MKIERNGIMFELTDEELTRAYFEQQHEFDILDVIGRIETITSEGLTRDTLLENASRVAYDMRRNIDKYGMEWQYAADAAIERAIDEILGANADEGSCIS